LLRFGRSISVLGGIGHADANDGKRTQVAGREQDFGLSGKAWAAIIILPTIAAVAGIWWVLHITSPRPSPIMADAAKPPVSAIKASSTASPTATLRAAPAPQQPNAELARLRNENQQLRQELAVVKAELAARPAVPPPPPEPVTPKIGSISGNVWVNKEDGSSDLLRGIHVEVLRTEVSGRVIQDILLTEARDWQKDADANRKKASDGFISDFYRSEAEKDQHSADLAKSTAQRVPTRNVDLLTSYQVAQKCAKYELPAFEPAISETAVADTRSDVQGKFELANIPAGNYYLHAASGSRVFYIEWLIPVTVKAGQDVKVDVFNENAVNIHNTR